MPRDRLLELQGDVPHRDAVTFQVTPKGELRIWIDGGETGDTEGGFYGVEAERTFSREEVERLKVFLNDT